MADILQLRKIRMNGGTQPRAGLNDETVAEYAAAMQSGALFPPVVVFYDGTDYWLADGFHRLNAHLVSDAQEIACEVHSGTQRDAVLYAAGANATHGLRRSNDDKRRAVLMLLEDDEWSQWSDRVIAEKCGVSHPFVGKVRASTGNITSTRKTANGTVMETVNIGAQPVKDGQAEHAFWKRQLYVLDFPDLPNDGPASWWQHIYDKYASRGDDPLLFARVPSRGYLSFRKHGDAVIGSLSRQMKEDGYLAYSLEDFGFALALPHDTAWMDQLLQVGYVGGQFYNDVSTYARDLWDSIMEPSPAEKPKPVREFAPVPSTPPALQPGDQVTTRTGHTGTVERVAGRLVEVNVKGRTTSHFAEKLTPTQDVVASWELTTINSSFSSLLAFAEAGQLYDHNEMLADVMVLRKFADRMLDQMNEARAEEAQSA
jgi:hypothetical protein